MYCGAGESVGARVNPESLVYLDVCLGISVLIKRGCTLGVLLVQCGMGGGRRACRMGLKMRVKRMYAL